MIDAERIEVKEAEVPPLDHWATCWLDSAGWHCIAWHNEKDADSDVRRNQDLRLPVRKFRLRDHIPDAGKMVPKPPMSREESGDGGCPCGRKDNLCDCKPAEAKEGEAADEVRQIMDKFGWPLDSSLRLGICAALARGKAIRDAELAARVEDVIDADLISRNYYRSGPGWKATKEHLKQFAAALLRAEVER